MVLTKNNNNHSPGLNLRIFPLTLFFSLKKSSNNFSLNLGHFFYS